MVTQEIIREIRRLPLIEQKRIYESLSQTLSLDKKSESELLEDEVERRLLAKGIISQIPPRLPDDEEETFEPIKVSGKPLSETIIEERR